MSSDSIRIDDYLEDGEAEANTISLGENDNTVTAYNQIVNDCVETQRLVDVQTALEDLTAIADSIEQATEKDVLLVNTALQAAMAGTDIRPDEIQPGLESFIGQRISTEGIGSFIKSIWDAIMSLLKRIWSMISKFFSGLFGRAARTEKKANALVSKFEQKMTAKAKSSSFSLGDEVNKLVRKGNSPRKLSDLNEGLKVNEQLLEDLENFIKAVNGISSPLAQAIAAFNPDDPTGSVDKVMNVVDEVCKKHPGLKLSTIGNDKRYIDGTFGGYEMFGNKRVIAKLPLTRNDAAFNNYLVKLSAAKGSIYDVEDVRPGLKDLSGATFPTLTPNEAVKLAQESSTLATKISNFSSRYKNLDLDSKEIMEVIKAGDKLTDLMKAKEDRGELNTEATTAYKSVVQISVTYSRWLTGFVVKTMNQIEVSNQALISLLEKSYKNLE